MTGSIAAGSWRAGECLFACSDGRTYFRPLNRAHEFWFATVQEPEAPPDSAMRPRGQKFGNNHV